MTEYQFNDDQLKWLAALESGDYEQCRLVLYDGVGYCCLGVACKALGLEPEEHEEYGLSSYSFDGEFELLPESIAQRLRLRSNFGKAERDHPESHSHCTQMNDTRGWDFNTIAARLREEPDVYFFATDAEAAAHYRNH